MQQRPQHHTWQEHKRQMKAGQLTCPVATKPLPPLTVMMPLRPTFISLDSSVQQDHSLSAGRLANAHIELQTKQLLKYPSEVSVSAA